eukprot:TRINITY_DN56081_c0_g1_i1.p2 TRINITY_DN56081_c0_g1~~TRINITY_DN56081_c0_g1_i1.p2  ORF type:complete len:121 (-),score=26.12 TRINITY_DN56081_c0_g1_i1:15-377(-)
MKRFVLAILAFAGGAANAAQLERPVERSGRLRSESLPSLAAEQDQNLAAAAPAPSASPAAGHAGGISKEVWMGYNRLFAHDYFERFGHWSTGGPQPLARAAEGPAAAPGPAVMSPAPADA